MVSRMNRSTRRCEIDQSQNSELTINPSENHRPNIDDEEQSNRQRSDGGVFGHHLRKKPNDSVRILFANINGLGDLHNEKKEDKLDHIKKFLIKHEIDAVGFAETNTDWRTLPVGQSMWSRTSSWFQNRRISTSHNDKAAPIANLYILNFFL